jgi:hypothetical protein
VASADEGGPACRGDATAESAASSRATAPGASDAEDVGEDTGRAESRDQGSELAACPAQFFAEVLAGTAVSEVAPRNGARAAALVVREGQLLPNLAAGRITGLGRQHKADPRPHQQRLDGRHGHSQRARELLIAHSTEFAHEQSRALLLGQTTNVGDQTAQRVPLLRLGDRIDRGANTLEELWDRQRRPPELVDATIVRHPVEPGSECEELAIVGPQP